MTVHRWPEVGGQPSLHGDTVPCCGRHCDDLPATDTLTAVPSRVDCPGPAPTDPAPSPGAATTTERNHPA